MLTRIMTVVVISVLLPGIALAQAKVSSCDRACLGNYVDRYMDAMLANDPSLELFSRDCKFTENGVRLPLGSEGLWFGMSGKGSYKFYIPDVETQQVAVIGTAQEGAAKGVTVNTVSPGYVDTPMTAAMRDDVREAIVDGIPMHRMGRPEEIAAAIAFLAAPESAYITGANIPVNGGLFIK